MPRTGFSVFFGCGVSSPNVLEGLEPDIIAKPRIASPPKFDKTQYCPIPELYLVHPLDRPNEKQLSIQDIHVYPSDRPEEKLQIVPGSRLLHPLDGLEKRLPTIPGPFFRPPDRLNKRLPAIPEDHPLLTFDRLDQKLPPLPQKD